MLPIICPSVILVGGVKEPSMYMHFCGLYLGDVRGYIF